MQAPDPLALRHAATVGLRYTTDRRPGIRRRRCGKGMAYRDPAGRAVRDRDALARIRALAIPPAWRDVWICADPQGHLQATGRDARGRKQYRYHPAWQAARGEHKFDQLRRFGQLLPAIRRRIQRALSGGDEPTRERVLATLVRLLDITGARIGSSAYARDNGSFGLSTLRNRHLRWEGDALRLGYVGKSGVPQSLRVSDRRVAAVVRRCRDLPGQALFSYTQADGSVHTVDSGDVNGWLSRPQADARGAALPLTSKHFRTWHASVLALSLLLQAATRAGGSGGQAGHAPATPAEVLAEVARELGNTVAVCRKAYIHPAVLAWLPALTSPAQRDALLARRWVAGPPAHAGLSRAERQLMGLLAEARREAHSPP